ncbi:unnamed protein product [Cunninghamella blakesleeana]
MASNKEKVDYKGDDYVKFRPVYPEELYSIIYDFYQEKSNDYERAADIGTGTGQCASKLAEKFQKVYGVDRLPDMIKHAIQKDNIEYILSDAETLPFEDHSLDVITSATAFHWFNHDLFFKEVKRVLKPNGVLAVWTYFFPMIKDNEEIDKIFKKNYVQLLMPYTESHIHHAITLYRDVEFPFKNVDRYICPDSEDIKHQSKKKFSNPLLDKKMSLSQFGSYLKTASAYSNYIKENSNDPADDVVDEVAKHLGIADKDTYIIHLEWPLGLVLCRD